MITLWHDINNNRDFPYTGSFFSDLNDQRGQDEMASLYSHLRGLLISHNNVKYVNFQPPINFLSAYFASLDDLMMVKLKFCGT